MKLIDKSRALNRLLQRTAGTAVSFKEMSEVLGGTIGASSFVISRKGKLLGYGLHNADDGNEVDTSILSNNRIDKEDNNLLFSVEETVYEIGHKAEAEAVLARFGSLFSSRYVAIVPIIGGNDRLGTLLLTRSSSPFTEDDIILAEYGATIVGMEILRGHVDEYEIEARNKAAVQVAVGSLSFSELEAVEQILEELNDKEGLLVASKIADKVGITRSVIVNALRKLESAGVIETRSLGMKGTYIKILNDRLTEEILKTDISTKV